MSHFFYHSNNEGAAGTIRRSIMVANTTHPHTYNSTSVLKCQEGIFESGTGKEKKKLNLCWMLSRRGQPGLGCAGRMIMISVLLRAFLVLTKEVVCVP